MLNLMYFGKKSVKHNEGMVRSCFPPCPNMQKVCYACLIQVQMWKEFFLPSTLSRQNNATDAVQTHLKDCYMPRTVLKSLVATNLKLHQIIINYLTNLCMISKSRLLFL